MKDQRFILTGGTSFIGRHLVQRLLEDGKSIILFVRDPSKIPHDWRGNLEVVEGDIREKNSLSKLPFEGSTLFHLAGEIKRKSLFHDINVDGTKNLMDLAAYAGTKHFIHLSSVGVFGYPKQTLIDENAACHPVNEYEKSKYEGERLLGEYYERRSIPITILRPSTVFGEGSNSESFLGWMRSIKNRTFRFIGGKAYANYVYVGDVVEALVSVSKAGRSGKEDFIVSDTKTMREFVRYAAEILGADVPDYSIPRWLAILSAEAITPMAKVFGKRFPLTVSRVKALTDRRIFSSEKIKKELGFQPKFGVMKGLQRTLMWYQREGLL